MGKFIKKSLEPGEQIVLQGHQHWSFVFGKLALCAVLVLAAIALAAYGARERQRTQVWNEGVLVAAVVCGTAAV
ncbi:MAG: hypothetical protein HUK03_10420, partial [Bacteroidaceae bacterium]|nr:hypothetical protein [Bacteroidaceae bacterium]